MLEQLITWDKELFLSLNNMGNPYWDPFWMFMTDKWSSIPLYLALLVMAFYFMGWRKALVLLVSVGLMITATDQLANAFKYGFERLRPCYDPELEGLFRLVKDSCGGRYGYFSAHAANSFALAVFFVLGFTKYFRLLPVILFLWAVMVAYSRVYIGVHFPMDIFTGMLAGLLNALIFYAVFTRALKAFKID